MPYEIKKKGDKYCVVKKTTGESKGCSDSMAEAKKHMAALYANEPKHAASRIVALGSYRGYSTRTETLDGREILVVPVVALVEGVVHAMNSESAELVTAQEFKRAPAGWNGRPIFHGHPVIEGEPVSGNLPMLYETLRIGTVFNSGIKSEKLAMEAWLDVKHCEERAPELLQRIRSGEGIEISVGTFVDTDDESGSYRGLNYSGKWSNITPDHLAILPEGQIGACSREMGCGIRAAAKGASVDDKKGKDGKEPDPKDEKDAKDKKKKRGLAHRIVEMFKAAATITGDVSDADIKDELREALLAQEPRLYDIISVYADRVIYSCYEDGYGVCYYQRAYTGEAEDIAVDGNRVEVEPEMNYVPVVMAGKRHSTKDQSMVQAMHDQAVALGAKCTSDDNGTSMDAGTASLSKQKNNAAGGCGCGGKKNDSKTGKW